MKRTELKRKTPLRSSGAIQRKEPMKRNQIRRTGLMGKPVRQKQSAKVRKFAHELDAITPALMERAGGRCEARIVLVCGTGPATAHRHHKRLRTDPACTNTLDCLLYICQACHDWIHGHPKEAKELGLLLGQWDKGNGYVPISAGTPAGGDAA